MDIVEFLTACLDEDELWAREASRDGDNPLPEGGVHWQWVNNITDEPIQLDPATMVYLDDNEEGDLSLRTCEEWPSGYGNRTLPYFAIPTAQEVPIAVAGHLVRHDPARVLADIAAKRQLLKVHRGDHICAGWEGESRFDDVPCLTACLMTAPYADRPGYNDAWKIDDLSP